MAKDDLYNRLFGITPEPPMTLSKLLGIYPPATPPSVATPLSKLFENYQPANLMTLSRLLGLPAPSEPAPHHTTLSQLMGLGAPAPAPVPVPKGIYFQDKYFFEPSAFASTWLPSLPGIYAILVVDFTCSPRPYRVLYFGKAIKLDERVVRSHEKYEEWERAAGSSRLYVSYHIMSDTTDWQRAAVEKDLIKYYAPPCNKTFNPFGF